MLNPIISYTNVNDNKKQIYKDNVGKSGIYMWTNLTNSKFYIGSSVSLATRFTIYFSLGALNKRTENNSSAIYSALLKYGYDNFKLDILEYCDPEIVITREQYYIDELKPEYNILKVANSRYGSTHTEETKLKIGSKVKGINHPFYGKEHTEDSRNKIRESLRLYYQNNKVIVKKTDTKLKPDRTNVNYKGIEIYVYDKDNNFIIMLPSIKKAAVYFNTSDRTMRRRLEKGYWNNYIFKLTN